MLNIKKYIFNLKTIFMIFLIFSVNIDFSNASDNIQILKEFVWGREFKFRIIPENTPLIPAFPFEVLKNDQEIKTIEYMIDKDGDYYSITIDSGNVKDSKVRVYFSINSSIKNAQIETMEKMAFCSLGFSNAIDHTVYHTIGDNCWYNIHNFDDNMNEIKDSEISVILFLRNNVRIWVMDEPFYDNSSAIIEVAEKVDQALINSQKVESPSLINFPVITSFEITGGSSVVGSSVTTKTEAYDPKGEKLILRRYGLPENLSREDGVYEFGSNKSGTVYMVVWVINEHRLVSMAYKEITF